MRTSIDSVQMLELAAEALATLLDQVAFVGGAVTWLYVDSIAAAPMRPTEDVDCVIEISSRCDYAKLEESLRLLGFKHDMSSGVICRWDVNGIKIDVMPTEPAILGFSNPWYLDGLANKEPKKLPSGTAIDVFPLAFFLASKFQALQSRGGDDWRTAHDLENILIVLDGCTEPVAQIEPLPDKVKAFLAETCAELLSKSNVNEILMLSTP